MTQLLLLPHNYKRIGWIILVPVLIIHILTITELIDVDTWTAPVFAIYHDDFLSESHSWSIIKTPILQTLMGVLFIIGALMVGFSKEKIEDEYIAQLRMNALIWAVVINYILLILAFIFIYGTPFLNIMIYNMFTILIIFIIRFHYLLFKHSKKEVYAE